MPLRWLNCRICKGIALGGELRHAAGTDDLSTNKAEISENKKLVHFLSAAKQLVWCEIYICIFSMGAPPGSIHAQMVNCINPSDKTGHSTKTINKKLTNCKFRSTQAASAKSCNYSTHPTTMTFNIKQRFNKETVPNRPDSTRPKREEGNGHCVAKSGKGK